MERRCLLSAVAMLLLTVAPPLTFAEENTTDALHVKVTSLSDDITQIEATDGRRFLLAVFQISTDDVSCYTDKHTNVLMAGGKDDDDNNANETTTTSKIIDGLLQDPATVLHSVEKEKVRQLFLYCNNIPEEAVQLLASLTNTTAPAHHRVAITKRRAKRFAGWAIYPGTKWCGVGNKSAHYDDLGQYSEVDQCCRAHDHCDITIPAWTYRFGKFNWYLWTVSHCSCDDTFRNCMTSVTRPSDMFAAKAVETIFFHLLGIRCFKFNFLGYAYYRE